MSYRYGYERLIVPFGQKHRGKRICQCRDKSWFLWTLTKKSLTEKVSTLSIQNAEQDGILISFLVPSLLSGRPLVASKP
jgi:hypothetical protein